METAWSSFDAPMSSPQGHICDDQLSLHRPGAGRQHPGEIDALNRSPSSRSWGSRTKGHLHRSRARPHLRSGRSAQCGTWSPLFATAFRRRSAKAVTLEQDENFRTDEGLRRAIRSEVWPGTQMDLSRLFTGADGKEVDEDICCNAFAVALLPSPRCPDQQTLRLPTRHSEARRRGCGIDRSRRSAGCRS